MAYNWFRLDNRMAWHRKTHHLEEILKDDNAGMYVIRLFSWAHFNTPSGVIPRKLGRVLERECRWKGAPNGLISALVESKWLESDAQYRRWIIHDWDEFQGDLIKKSERDAEAKKVKRAAKRTTAAVTSINRKRRKRLAAASQGPRGGLAAASQGPRSGLAGTQVKSPEQEENLEKTARAASPHTTQQDPTTTSPPTPFFKAPTVVPPTKAVHEGDEQKREGQGDEEAQATAFVGWAQKAAKKLRHPIGDQTAGHTVWTSTRYFFLKRGSTEENQLRLRAAFLDFLLTMKKSGWGMWLGNNVWEPRYNDVIVGKNPDLFKLMAKLDTVELPEQTSLHLGPLNAIGG